MRVDGDIRVCLGVTGLDKPYEYEVVIVKISSSQSAIQVRIELAIDTRILYCNIIMENWQHNDMQRLAMFVCINHYSYRTHWLTSLCRIYIVSGMSWEETCN